LLVFALGLNLFYGFLLTVFLGREGSLFPLKYDQVLFHLDESLGVRAADIAPFLQGQWRFPLWVIYQSMVPMMICWFLVIRYSNHRGSIVLAYVAALVAGPLTYTIVPACGPIYAFGARWLQPVSPPIATMQLAGLPNAFPSLHVATALVFVLLAPGRLWRTVSLVFLAATCMATVATGEHYVIDLIPGLAFGVFAGSIGLKSYRWGMIFLGIVCCWSAAVRFGFLFLIRHPIVTRSSAALTVSLVVFRVWKVWSENSDLAPTPDIAQEAGPALPVSPEIELRQNNC
jgi:hypothetical protein